MGELQWAYATRQVCHCSRCPDKMWNLSFCCSLTNLSWAYLTSKISPESGWKASLAVGLQVFDLSQPPERIRRLCLFLIAMRPRRRHSATYKVHSRSIIKNHCMLSRSEFFKGSSEKFLHELSTMLEVDLFLPGQDIIQQGPCGMGRNRPMSVAAGCCTQRYPKSWASQSISGS